MIWIILTFNKQREYHDLEIHWRGYSLGENVKLHLDSFPENAWDNMAYLWYHCQHLLPRSMLRKPSQVLCFTQINFLYWITSMWLLELTGVNLLWGSWYLFWLAIECKILTFLWHDPNLICAIWRGLLWKCSKRRLPCRLESPTSWVPVFEFSTLPQHGFTRPGGNWKRLCGPRMEFLIVSEM